MSRLARAVERIGDMALVESSREGWIVPMRVLDVRTAYGRIDYLCRPEHGGEDAWVGESRVAFNDKGGNE